MSYCFENDRPIYIQLLEKLQVLIISGNIKIGERLPSVRDLADELKVNPNTIVRAYQELEREGITETRRGMGTFVVENDKNSILQMKKTIGKNFAEEFIKKMREAGVSDDEIMNLVKEALNTKN